MNVKKTFFGKSQSGESVNLYTLTNKNKMIVKIIDYGGIVTSILVPNKTGELKDVVLGFEKLDKYLRKHPYFGSTIGRYANRIAKGKFKLGDTQYKLATNDGNNHLHGGLKGFDKVSWNSEVIENQKVIGVKLDYLSKDGEEGYPGNLKVVVKFFLNNKNELKIEYRASTDKPTPINLTHHSYFNLKGDGDILSHFLTIHAEQYTPVSSELIPTGEILNVKGSPMDFTSFFTIGKRIKDVKGGYDHNYVLKDWDGSLRIAATLFEPISGIKMDVLTTEPGIQFYSGNFLDGSIIGKGGVAYEKYGGLCLEAQHFPDSPNQPSFPDTVLKPGEIYTQTTIYRFSLY